MMAQGSFAAQVSAWVAKTHERTEAVFKESTQRVIARMQTPVGAGGNMPVDTGYLRASLMASTSMPPPRGGSPVQGQAYAYDVAQVSLVIAGAELGQTIYATYGANYARVQEYGAEGRPGRGFVRLAAQQWPAIVAAVATEAETRAG